MRARSGFNSAVLLAACGLPIVLAATVADGPVRDDPRCTESLGVVLENSGGTSSWSSENGDDGDDPVRDGVAYAADARWTDGNITYGCVCRLRECIRKCCRDDEVLRNDLTKMPVCERMPRGPETTGPAETPALRLTREQLAEEIQDIGELRNHFFLVEHLVCPTGTYALNPDKYAEDKVVLQANGSLVDANGNVFPLWNYCLDWQMTYDRIGVLVCLTPEVQSVSPKEPDNTANHVGIIISIPFLFATFLVYAITPELRNLYGKTLMCYIVCLIVAYIFLILANYIDMSSPILCIVTAFVIHFSFLASFFWLNVMCFDIWWTFGGFRSLQGSVKQRERKKFIMYSIYAWGSASVLTIVCAIMDFVPSVPKELIRPEFGVERCWFSTDAARALYFYGPMGVTVICNICLFISTAFKIVRHRRDTAHHLSSSESRRHDDNKQWFNLYLKLFIVMGINWSMEIVSWLFKSAPDYIWYLTDITNTLQGLIIFITFVWKKKIKRLLLKRFGCQERGLFSRNSTRSGCHSSASRTCTTTSVMPLQEKISPYVHANCRPKNSSDEAECP